MGKKKKDEPDDRGPTSLFLFTPTSPVRKLMTWLVNWPPFEWIIIITIMANCVVMALDDKLSNNDKSIMSIKLEEMEIVFMVVFTTEMLTKILALGFMLHKGSYMRNPWNFMDFFVVTSGFLPYVMPESKDGEGAVDLSTLRTFRVLRPLKLVSGVPSLQVVMSSIAKAIGPLVNIALLLFFAVLIFAIIGLEFYAGALNKTCYSLDNLDEIVKEGEKGSPCFIGNPSDAPWGANICDTNVSVCLEKWAGPNAGITSFDNIGLAMLTVFQCVTMENWIPILYATNDALGTVFNWVFFIPLIVVGSFFMLNLVLGVLSGEFAKEKDRVESRAGFLLLKEEQKLEKEMNGYMNWICKAEDLVLAEERTSKKDRQRIMEVRRVLAEGKRKVVSEEDELKAASGLMLTLKKFKFWVRRMCKQQWWFWLVIILVFLNTCTVAVEHYNQPDWLTDFLFYAELVFLCAFVFEMVIRMYALGPNYFDSAFNKFDCVVIFGSIFEVFWVNFKPRAGSFGLSGLRALRLLRVFKVTKYWSPLRNLVIALMNALSSIMSLLLLLFLFIFIFALLGMQFFGGQLNFPEGTPTSNFDSIINALLTVFQVLTGEDWNTVMYTAIRSKGGRSGGGAIYSTYFVILLLCGDWTLLNVFLAIACDSLDQAAELTAAEEAEKERQEQEQEAARIAEQAALGAMDPSMAGAAAAAAAEDEDEEALPEEEENRPILPYSSFFILSSTNPVRIGLHWFVTRPFFDGFIMFVILLSSVALALEDPVKEDSERNQKLGLLDYGFTAIFAIECLLKMLDLGMFLHPGAYLRDVWNVMDISVVSCAILSFYFKGTPTGAKLKSMKLLRVLRPLKMINRVPALKAVFDCVMISLKNVFNILIVYMLFLLIFAMVGVQLFNGKFFHCNDESKNNAQDCQGEYFVFDLNDNTAPEIHQREWTRKAFHYDNCAMAMITLFAVQTSEGWIAVLQDSMSSTYEDEGPLPWFRTEMAIYYIVYFVVFPFFFVNIFVALVIVTFNELGEAELTDNIDKNQKSCITYVVQIKPQEIYVPETQVGVRYHIWRLVTSPPFENFIMLLIILNTLLLMCKFQGAPLEFSDVLADLNLIFTAMFTVECVLKISSFGPKPYFKDAWNTFDFITVAGSIIDATGIVEVGFLRLFRAARLIKLLRRSVSIRILLYTFVQSIKALPYVMMLMMMLFFIYAIIGMQMFGNIAYDPTTAIDRHNNFRNIFQANLMLFRCATGEAWPDIMMSAVDGRPCDADAHKWNYTKYGELYMTDPEKRCGSPVTYLYFITFIFLCSFIMLNIVVAVITDSFDYLTRDSSILGSHHLSEFVTTWCEYDPAGEGLVHYTDLLALLRQIDPPLGFGSKCPDLLAYKRLVRMNMPVDEEGKVHFKSTLFSLIRINLQIFMRSMEEMDQADQELRAAIQRSWPSTRGGTPPMVDLLVPPPEETGPGKLTVGKVYGGMLILENWKLSRFGQGFNTNKSSLPNGGAMLNNNKTLMDAPVPQPCTVTTTTPCTTSAPAPVPTLAPTTVTTAISTTDPIVSTQAAPPPPIYTQSNMQQQQQFQQQQQQQFQQLQQLPEPLIPLSQPIDTKQEIVENYLNSLPPPATQENLNLTNGNARIPMDISSSLAEGEPSLNQLMNGNGGNRFRGVSVDRHREYRTPQYYEDTYYKRDPYDSSGDDRGKYDSLPGRHRNGGPYHNSNIYEGFEEPLSGEERTIFKLERQWSHPNLRPRPSNQGRRLPKTPKQPPGIVIPSTPSRQEEHFTEWIENERMRRTPMLSGQRSFESDNYSPPRTSRDPHSFSPPRTDTRQVRRTPVPERSMRYGTGTGRMLPKPPPGGSHLVLSSGRDKPAARVSRERKLPKPSSLEIRNPSRDLPSRSTSINFPRIDSSPTRMSNFIDGTSIIPSLPPSRTVGYPRRNLPALD